MSVFVPGCLRAVAVSFEGGETRGRAIFWRLAISSRGKKFAPLDAERAFFLIPVW